MGMWKNSHFIRIDIIFAENPAGIFLEYEILVDLHFSSYELLSYLG